MKSASVLRSGWPLRAAVAGVAALVWAVFAQAAENPAPTEPFKLVEPLQLADVPAPAPAVKAPAKSDDDWRMIMSLGLWTPLISGDAGVGRVVADIDLDIGDVLNDLNFALFPGFEVGKGKWAVIFNGAYAQLEDEVPFSRTTRRGHVIEGDADLTLEMYVADLALGYRLFDIPLAGGNGKEMVLSLMPVIGVRYTYLSLEIDPDRIASRSGDQDWWDPYVGARVNLQFNDELAWRTEGSVGGFGVGSDFAWALQSMLDWRFHGNWELNLGYRVVSWDYDQDDVVWDITIHGPWIGVSYHLK